MPTWDPTWEYCRVFVGVNSALNLIVGGTSQNLSGHPRVTQGLDLDSCLAVLGQEAWELVTVIGDRASMHLIFKRRKS
jgi:hypothetical protein